MLNCHQMNSSSCQQPFCFFNQVCVIMSQTLDKYIYFNICKYIQMHLALLPIHSSLWKKKVRHNALWVLWSMQCALVKYCTFWPKLQQAVQVFHANICIVCMYSIHTLYCRNRMREVCYSEHSHNLRTAQNRFPSILFCSVLECHRWPEK